MTEQKELITDITNWRRVGKGHELQFFATTSEIQEWLVELPAKYAPYNIVGVERISENGRYIDQPFQCACTKLEQCVTAATGGYRHNFWIQSVQLTPVLPVKDGVGVDALYSYNGLVHLHHELIDCEPSGAAPLIQPSRIAIVSKIFNSLTKSEQSYRNYLEIYQELRTTIRRDLTYTSIVVFPSGASTEDKSVYMSSGAVEAYHNGASLTHVPGPKRS